MAFFGKLKGTIETVFQVGLGRALWKSQSTGELEARNSADSAFAPVRGADANSTSLDNLINVRSHKALRDVIHFLSHGPGDGVTSGAFFEKTGGVFPSSTIWYTSAAKTSKILEKTFTRNGAHQATTVVYKMYDADGSTVLVTVTDTITYSGALETSRTRTWV